MITGPKTVLVVDDEHALRHLMVEGLPPHLPGFEVVAVANGQEAIDFLTSHPVEVVVTDIAMPVKDGFELLAYVRNNHPNLPAVVLTVTDVERVTQNTPRLGILRVLQKPASPATVAREILAARSETVRGRMTDVPLATLLELMQMERKTCSLFVRSGDRRGRLHFRSGELVNAYSFELDQEGEEAARHLLALDEVTIDFERSLHNHLRRIHTPLATLLMDVARTVDERHRDAVAASGSAAAGGGATTPHSLGSAAAHLQSALTDLRARTANVARSLDASAPVLAESVRTLIAAAPTATLEEEHRIAAAWGEVSELAERLARLADTLGTTPKTPRV